MSSRTRVFGGEMMRCGHPRQFFESGRVMPCAMPLCSEGTPGLYTVEISGRAGERDERLLKRQWLALIGALWLDAA